VTVTTVQAAFDTLRDEHRTVERILDLLGKIASLLRDESPVARDLLPQAIDLTENFVAMHEVKEEVIFPLLEIGNWRYHDTLEILSHEHERSRNLLTNLREAATSYSAGNSSARTPILGMIEAYRKLLREHIDVEDNAVFSTRFLSSRSISKEKLADVLADFNETQSRSEASALECIGLLEKLENQLSR